MKINSVKPFYEVNNLFIGAIFSGYEGPHFIEVQSLTPRLYTTGRPIPGSKTHSAAWFFKSPKELCERRDKLIQHAQGDLYFGVLPRRHQRFGTKDSLLPQARVLWCDVDMKGFDSTNSSKPTHRDFVRRTNVPPPSYVVDSGFGLHYYWLLEDTVHDLDWIEAANKGISNTIHGDCCYNSNRILRLPGTFNRKVPDDIRPVTIIESVGIRYPSAMFSRLHDIGKESMLGLVTSADIDHTMVDAGELRRMILELPEFARTLIYEGVHSAPVNKFLTPDGRRDRSMCDYYIISMLIDEGWDPSHIKAVFMSPSHGISDKTLSHPYPDKYINGSILRAIKYLEKLEHEKV